MSLIYTYTWSELIWGYVESKNIYLGEITKKKREMSLVLKGIASGVS